MAQQQQQRQVDPGEVSVRSLTASVSSSAQLTSTVMSAIAKAPMVPYFLLRVVINLIACWGAPFVRQRMGRYTVFATGAYAFLFLVAFTGAFPEGQPRVLAQMWSLALMIALGCRGFGAMRRVLWPRAHEAHVHRWSMGEPSETLQRLHRRFGGWASPHVTEVVLFLALTLGVSVLGPMLNVTGRANSEYVWMLPVMVAAALVAQRLMLDVTDKLRLALLEDERVAQESLAEALSDRHSATATRHAEGFAEPAGATR